MKLIGVYEAQRTSGVYVSTAEITVVLGANDSGKSRLLTGIASHLDALARLSATGFMSLTPTPDIDDRLDLGDSMAFFEFNEAELNQVLRSEVRYLLEGNSGDHITEILGQRVLMSERLSDELARAEKEGLDAAAFAKLLSGLADDPASTGELARLAKSRVIGLGISRVQDSTWDITDEAWWCIQNDESDARWAGGYKLHTGLRDLVLPSPYLIPNTWDVVQERTRTALGRVIEQASFLARSEDDPEWSKLGPADFSDKRAWLEVREEGAVLRLRDEVWPAVSLATALLNSRLPPFVAERISMRIAVDDLMRWTDQPVAQIEAGTADEDGQEVFFDIEDTAQGFQPWMQMAALDTATRLEHITLAIAIGQMWLGDNPYQQQVRDLWTQVTAWASGAGPQAKGVDLAVALADVAFASRSQQMVPRETANIYVLDEPERHLHPSVARAAAGWLRTLIADGTSQVLLASHAAAFLDYDDAAIVNYARRRGLVNQLDEIDNDELKAVSLIAEEMGFDRGELLSSIRTLLFVEGRADELVLRNVYGRQLREAGVELVPVHGVLHLPGILEAEVLWRYTSAAIAVLVDNDIAKLASDFSSDASARSEGMRQRSNTELHAIAKLYESAAQAEKQIRLFSIPTFDMFGLLDEDLIRERVPEFPGHLSAERLWIAARDGKAQRGIGRKKFLRQTYGPRLIDLEMFDYVSREMSRAGMKPHVLTAVVAALSGRPTKGTDRG